MLEKVRCWKISWGGRFYRDRKKACRYFYVSSLIICYLVFWYCITNTTCQGTWDGNSVFPKELKRGGCSHFSVLIIVGGVFIDCDISVVYYYVIL